jgi:hypothetical protein
LFTGVYGTAWAVGSIVIGVLASVALDGLIVFCSVTELAAIPPILAVSARTRHATPRPGYLTGRGTGAEDLAGPRNSRAMVSDSNDPARAAGRPRPPWPVESRPR